MSETFNVSGVVLPPRPLGDGSAITAAALERLYGYLRHNPEAAREEAFMAGFRYGARWAVDITAALADPQFRRCISMLAEIMARNEP